MKKDKFIELEIESIGFEGISIARADGVVYFVKDAIPGDKVIARVKKKKKKYYQADIHEILEPSQQRIEAPCKYFDYCGGCRWQHLDYSQQLFWKKQHVKDAFHRIAKLDVGEYFDTLPSPNEYEYRNKMEFSFSAQRWLTAEEVKSEDEIAQKDFALGLHVPGRFDKVIDIDGCMIQHKAGNKVIEVIRDKSLTYGVSAWDSHKQEGFLKNLIIRTTAANEELMVVLVTNDTKTDEEQNFMDWYYNELAELLPNISVLAHAVNNSLSPVAKGETVFIKGEEFITEKILGLDFRISPYSFFQTNPSQLNRFIKSIVDSADLEGDELVWDLYCGTGSITLPASKRCKGIIGIELSESSINDAKNNAELNEINNTEFFCSDLHAKTIPELLTSLPQPDVIIIDPPRAGMHTNLVEHLLKVKAKRIVYVSCNPATQARDCELLSELYEIQTVQPVDMFPHTYHIESIAVLTLIDNG